MNDLFEGEVNNGIVIMVENNSPVTLNCSFDDPSVELFWVQTFQKEGVYDVALDQRVQILNNGTSLYFGYVVQADEEYYSCAAAFSNGTNKILKKYYLYVQCKHSLEILKTFMNIISTFIFLN